MPKQLNVDFNINANIAQAKKQIQELQQILNNLTSSHELFSGFTGTTEQIDQALISATKLRTQLQSAFNTKTGKLDLAKFVQEMDRSGMSLEKYKTQLTQLGPEGSKAFTQLATQITKAEVPLLRTNKLLNEMGTVLKNTIKWQISSTAIHGFVGSIEQAYSYAQKLNKSLTDIQIVTQASSEDMAAFAERANKAAQALSTTTTAYTNAALIFYQQGLDDEQVKERTDATIKMAQVTGDSAREVSSYMTAIWNNFDDGTQNLEYYADAIAALGAATASSSAEIAEGMQKFASIADTVGLSYEYATASLATVVAQTRLSADVVGTAFKTLFARVQDLDLGKTLEDGTDLGQYSLALHKVGVEIKDANGNLRAMDEVLNDLGAAWKNLADDEKVALAQTVAGQRQYAQLMALMENWDEVLKNVGIADNSLGTLQKQADIYADSWEGAQKRVRAAAEDLFTDLIDDKFFIKMNNFLAEALKGISKLIDSLGGLPGLLSTIGVIATNIFQRQIAQGLRDVGSTISLLMPGGMDRVRQQQTKALELTDDKQRAEILKIILDHAEQLSDYEMQMAENALDNLDTMTKELDAEQEILDAKRDELVLLQDKQRLLQEMTGASKTGVEQAKREYDEAKLNRDNLYDNGRYIYAQDGHRFTQETGEKLYDILREIDPKGSFILKEEGSKHNSAAAKHPGTDELRAEQLKGLKEQIERMREEIGLTEEAYDEMIKKLTAGGKRSIVKSDAEEYWEALREALKKSGIEIDEFIKKQNQVVITQKKAAQAMAGGSNANPKDERKALTYLKEEEKLQSDIAKQEEEISTKGEGVQRAYKRTKDIVVEMTKANGDWAQSLTTVSSAFMGFSMALNGIKSIISTLNNDDMSFGEKTLSIMTSLAFIIPSVIRSYEALNSEQLRAFATQKLIEISTKTQTGLINQEVISMAALLAAKKVQNAEDLKKLSHDDLLLIADKAHISTTRELTEAELRQAVADNVINKEYAKTATMEQLLTTAKAKHIVLTKEMTDEEIAFALAEKGVGDEAVLSSSKIMASLAPLLPLILGITAAIAVLYAGFKIAQYTLEGAERSTQNAEKAAQDLAERVNEVKQEYEDLKSSIENYTKSKKALEDMTEGTLEWQEALVNLNAQAMELIKNLNLIQGRDWTFGSNGQIEIEEDSLIQGQRDELARYTRTQAASTFMSAMSQSMRNDRNVEAYIIARAQKMNDEEGNTDYRNYITDQVNQAIDAYRNGDTTLSSLEDIDEETRQSLLQVAEASIQASTQLESFAEASGRTAITLDETYQQATADIQQLVAGAYSRLYGENLPDIYEEQLEQINDRQGADIENGILNSIGHYASDLTDLVLSFTNNEELQNDSFIRALISPHETFLGGLGSEEAAAAFAQFAESQNLNDLEDFQFERFTTDGEAIYSYLEDGERQFKTVSAEYIAAINAQTEQENNLQRQTELLVNQFEVLGKSLDQSDQALANFLSSGNFEQATYSGFLAMNDRDYLEQTAIDLGYNDLTDMLTNNGLNYMDLAVQRKNGIQAWNDVNSSGYIDQLSDNISEQISLGSANALETLLNDTINLGPTGEKAGEQFIQAMNSMLSGVEADKMGEAIDSILSDVDWTTNNAINQAASELRKYGVIIDTTSKEWVDFADSMRMATGYIEDFSQLKDELQAVSSILGKLDFGKVIDEKDYEQLVQYNNEWERFFMLQADGSRIFLGNAQEMLEAQQDNIRMQQQELLARRELAESYLEDRDRRINWGTASHENTTGRDVATEMHHNAGLNQIITDMGYTDESVLALTNEQLDQLISKTREWLNTDWDQEGVELEEMLASTATSFETLNNFLNEGSISEDTFQKQRDYLLEICTSVEQLDDAYQAGIITLTEYNNALTDTLIRQGEQLGLQGDVLLVQAQEMAAEYNLEAGAAARLALQNELMNKGVTELHKNWKDWSKELAKTDHTTQDYAETIVNVTKAIKDLVGITADDFTLSRDFFETAKNIELIGKAAQGSEDAISELGVAVASDLIEQLDSLEDVVDLSLFDDDAANDLSKIFEGFDENKNTVLAGLQELQDQINNIGIGEDVTGILTEEWVEALNEMAVATNMSVDQMNDLLNSMGVDANVTTTTIKTPVSVPHYITEETVTPIPTDNGDGLTNISYRRESQVVRQWMDTIDGEMEVAQLNMGDGNKGKAPTITRISNGSVSNSAKTASKSGGGGGKSSKKKPKDPTGEKERYHVINNQIEDNEKALDRLSKAKDRAYGKARLNAMDAEIAKQRESVELAEKKLQEVEEYLKLDAGVMAGFGAEFDANGTILNYDQLMQEQIDRYNAAVEAYNSSDMGDDAEAVFDQAEQDYEDFTKALEQYEETQDLWYEQAQAVADAKAQVLQLELEKTNYKVEIGIEWEEEDIARLDFMLKRIEDDAHKAAEAIGLLGEKTVDAMDQYNVYQQGFADTLRNLGVSNAEDIVSRAMGGEDLYSMIGSVIDPNQFGQAVDQLDDYVANMMSSLEQAQEAVDQAFEKVQNLFSENVKQMDTYIDKIEFCQKITKSYMNIVDIVGKKSLGITNEMLRTFNAESVTQAVNNEAAAKAKMDSIQAQLLESQARLAQASGEAEQKYWNEIIEEQEKELISATENFHQAWEDALQANLEAFENNIELVIEDFSNAVGDLNAMKAEWDLQKSLTDMWEPEYERWHQLSDLINDINKSVDENENLKYKQDLLDLEQEIAALQEEEAQLSEYDLNYLRLRYEAKLAEIALEEAQNAKSQVRMSRDNEGNYSYVYTADEDAVNNAADDYRNKIYEMEKANEEYIDTLQEQLLDMHDKMLEDIKEAGDLYGIGTEAYFEAVDRIEQTYLGQSQFIQAQMQNVFDNNQRLRDEDIIQYVAYTGDIAAQNVDLQLSFADTYMGIQTQSDDLNTYFNDTWIPALETTFDNAREVTDHYVETNEAAMETAGTTMDEFSARATQDMAMATAQTEELARQTKNYGDTAVRAFAQAAQAWQTGPGSMLNAIESQAAAIANLAQQYTSLKSQLDAATASAIALAQAMNQPVSSSPSTVGGTTANGGSGDGSPYSSNGGLGTKDTLTSSNNTQTPDRTMDYYYAQEEARRAQERLIEELRKNKTKQRFASGGYTGEWSDEPRWALLDQKELVLNAKDTMNILSAVDVVRQLANSIDLNTMSANIAGASIKSASGTPGTIEQRVEITASFPNATDRNEIEQAFQNLVNHASQYANRKD